MRVAIFTDNDFDKVNGVTTALKAVLRHATGVEPRIYTTSDTDVDLPDYLSLGSLGVGLPWYREMRVSWPRLWAFARALRSDDVKVIHLTTPGPVGFTARWLAAHLRLPLVGSYHTHLGDYVKVLSGSGRLAGGLEHVVRWCYRPCQPILVPSAATRDLLVARGYDASRLRIWSRGVDTERFSPTRRSHALRDAWHVDHRRPAILYCGRLSREKGLDILAPLQQRLHRHGLAHQLVFVGDGPMRAELQARCPDAVFLGSLPHHQVGQIMASADLFLFPSATDTLGNVVLECQAAGLPAVVSDQGGPQEQVQPGSTGLVCAARSVDSFADALIALLRAPGRRVEMGRRAREYSETRDWPSSLTPLLQSWQEASLRASVRVELLPVPPAHSAFQEERPR